jgi:hypothetical protein
MKGDFDLCADKTPPDLDPFADDGESIFACASREELLRRWDETGDARWLEIIHKCSPPDLLTGPLRGERDEEIRGVARWLVSIIPGVTRTRLAKLIALAGRAVARGDSLRSSAVPELDDEERVELAARVADILAWAPGTTRGHRWPSKRQIDAILK